MKLTTIDSLCQINFAGRGVEFELVFYFFLWCQFQMFFPTFAHVSYHFLISKYRKQQILIVIIWVFA